MSDIEMYQRNVSQSGEASLFGAGDLTTGEMKHPTMTTEETNCLVLLDDYARTRHRCFLTEFFLSAIQIEYVLCFRPTGMAPSLACGDCGARFLTWFWHRVHEIVRACFFCGYRSTQ